MSKVCAASQTCPFAPEQTTGGCPCAELCPGFKENTDIWYSSNTTEDATSRTNRYTETLYDDLPYEWKKIINKGDK